MSCLSIASIVKMTPKGPLSYLINIYFWAFRYKLCKNTLVGLIWDLELFVFDKGHWVGNILWKWNENNVPNIRKYLIKQANSKYNIKI